MQLSADYKLPHTYTQTNMNEAINFEVHMGHMTNLKLSSKFVLMRKHFHTIISLAHKFPPWSHLTPRPTDVKVYLYNKYYIVDNVSIPSGSIKPF